MRFERRRWHAGENGADDRRHFLATCAPGAFDPFAEAIRIAHQHGAWVHVDGAFGLFAAASDRPPAPH